MATVRKVVRVSNPRRRVRKAKVNGRRYKSRNAKGRFVKGSAIKRRSNTRRRRTAKKRNGAPVIRRYSVKTLKKEIRRRGGKVGTTTKRRRRYSRRRGNSTKRKQNPVLIELGAVNPRRRKHVARRKRTYRKTRNSRRRRVNVAVRRRVRRVRAANPQRRRRYTRRRRTANAHHRRTRRYGHRRNPAIFGRSGGKDLLMMVGGGLVGVAATKFLPTLLPSSISSSLSGMGPFAAIALTGAGAFAAAWIAKAATNNQTFADAVLFGGLMQAGSALLTAVAPASLSSRLALSGIGDLVPGQFVVPQNPIKAGAMFAIPAPAGVGAWRGSFAGGRRW